MKNWLRHRRWLYPVLVYLVLCGAFYFYQHLFFFQPRRLDVNHALTFPFRARFTAQRLAFDSQTVIDVVRFLPDSTPKGVVIFFHGNRYNVEHYSTYAPYFTRRGWECWMPDYPGYGRSTGEVGVEELHEVGMQLYKMAHSKYAAERIVLYGKSLGTGVAAYVAGQRDCAALLLETPYQRLSGVAASFLYGVPVALLMRSDLEPMADVDMVKAPILAWHGTRDELIPLSHAAGLQAVLKPTDRFVVVPGAAHNTIPRYAGYTRSLDSMLLQIASRLP